MFLSYNKEIRASDLVSIMKMHLVELQFAYQFYLV